EHFDQGIAVQRRKLSFPKLGDTRAQNAPDSATIVRLVPQSSLSASVYLSCTAIIWVPCPLSRRPGDFTTSASLAPAPRIANSTSRFSNADSGHLLLFREAADPCFCLRREACGDEMCTAHGPHS